MTESTETPKRSGEPAWIGWTFAFFIVVLYFFGLRIPLLGPDEPRYAQVAREMFERGDWITTTLGGFNWFEKPSLLYWVQIVSFQIFGVSEVSARLGPAIFGLGTAFSVLLVARAWADTGHQPRNSSVSFWIPVVTATSLGMLVFSRGASFDITVTFPLTASLSGFFIWFVYREKDGSVWIRRSALFAFYFFCGASLLAKGLIGIVFPFAIVAFFYLLRLRLPAREFLISILWGLPLAAAVAGTWYLPMYLRHGWEFVDEFIIQHHLQRFTSNKYRHPQPFWFFWLILPAMTVPWIPFFAAAVWKQIGSTVRHLADRFRNDGSGGERPFGALGTFALAWMLVPLVFFSFSGSKLPGYILPSLPAAMILAGLCVSAFAGASRVRDLVCKGLAGVTIAVIFFLLAFIVPQYAEADSAKPLIDAAPKNLKVVNFLSGYHSLEFYAAGRLERNADGTQRRFEGVEELSEFISRQAEREVLVVVEKPHSDVLTGDARLDARMLAENAENRIYIVRPSGEAPAPR